jgi:hypothetical protein
LPVILLIISCSSDDKNNPVSDDDSLQEKITFSGYEWYVRNNEQYQGPGSNVFHSGKKNVWVDTEGKLHLKIRKINDVWTCSEIYTKESFGYGRYIFYVESTKLDSLDENVVLGLFTWDNESFKSMANTELDIEFAKWGYAEEKNTLQYSVQPTNGGEYPERYHHQANSIMPENDVSMHLFEWTASSVYFAGYKGYATNASDKIDNWIFTSGNPARQKKEDGMTSDAIVVPSPTPDTKVHINLWLFDSNRDGFGDAPTDGKEVEIVIKKFEFVKN